MEIALVQTMSQVELNECHKKNQISKNLPQTISEKIFLTKQY